MLHDVSLTNGAGSRGAVLSRIALASVSLLACLASPSCAAEGVHDPLGASGGGSDASIEPDALPDSDTPDTSADGGTDAEAAVFFDVTSEAHPWDPDAACATAVEQAQVVLQPVDIIWLVDNSASMQPAVDEVTAGLNDFASFIASQNLDYRVIMLSYRSKTNPVTVNGSSRYAVCIPPPLAGDGECGNGTRFYQSSIDIRSTQPLEQFLGTLDQTAGYAQGEEKGGEPWQPWLRPEATKTIVVVTDDNSRLTATQFEQFPGGQNPYNSLTLPPGILHASRSGLFEGYVFHGLYGWGSDTDPGVKCTYADLSEPPSSGPTYTELVLKTSGARAQICDGSSEWQQFFDAVAQAVTTTSKLSCELPIPQQDGGNVDPAKVNVRIVGEASTEELFKVAGASECGPDGGWYYDDASSPTAVILCPASCELAQTLVGVGKTGSIEVLFGCESLVK